MALSTMPKFDELMVPTLNALKALGGSASNEELFDRIVGDLGIPDSIRDAPHGGGTVGELAYRLAWSRTYLHGVGAIQRSQRGVWSITDKGEAVTPADIDAIKRAVRAVGQARRAAGKATVTTSTSGATRTKTPAQQPGSPPDLDPGDLLPDGEATG